MILTAALQPCTSYWNKVGNGRSAVSVLRLEGCYLFNANIFSHLNQLKPLTKAITFPPDYKTLWLQIDMSVLVFLYLMSITAVYSPTGMRAGGRGRPGGCCRGGSTTGRRTARGSARWWRGRCCGPSWSRSARHSAGSHSPGPAMVTRGLTLRINHLKLYLIHRTFITLLLKISNGCLWWQPHYKKD